MNLKKELPLIGVVLLPFVYLGVIWNQLPQKVPMHWNLKGEIDRYGDKTELILIPILLPLLVYVIFLVAPKIDPKNKLGAMGNKLYALKALLVAFMALLALFIIFSAKHQSFTIPNLSLILIGLLYVVLGNYFKTIKPNYFIGIRTPWALENEKVWKETHKIAGKMWFIGGIVVVVSVLAFDNQSSFVLFLAVTGIIAIVPMVYSYFLFQNEKKKA